MPTHAEREKKSPLLFYRTPWSSYRKSANIKMHSKKSSVILSSCFSPTMSLTFPMGQFICRRGKRRRKLSNRAEGAITKYSAASPDPPLNTLNKHIKRKQKERTSLWLCSIFLNDFCYVIIIIVRGIVVWCTLFSDTQLKKLRPKGERYPRIDLVAFLKTILDINFIILNKGHWW